jgi:hypothetical protein
MGTGLSSCDGWGFLTCRCGGDVCVCGLDGMECPGCEECEESERESEEITRALEEEYLSRLPVQVGLVGEDGE